MYVDAGSVNFSRGVKLLNWIVKHRRYKKILFYTLIFGAVLSIIFSLLWLISSSSLTVVMCEGRSPFSDGFRCAQPWYALATTLASLALIVVLYVKRNLF